jgi:predicted nucleotide-binding protein
MDTFTQKAADLIDAGWNVNRESYEGWAARVEAFLSAAIDREAAERFRALGDDNPYFHWAEYRDRQVGHLEGLALRIEASGLSQEKAPPTAEVGPTAAALSERNTRVFLVHGHDVGAKESAARFLEKIKLEPMILHEQANEGRTVIEKFEAHANVGFAVVLLTPDDVGASVGAKDRLLGRARQNVILELGYFTGKLGRGRVCALYKTGVEIPSDFHGVLFIEFDEAGAWKTKLAQELVQGGMQIDIQGLLQS